MTGSLEDTIAMAVEAMRATLIEHGVAVDICGGADDEELRWLAEAAMRAASESSSLDYDNGYKQGFRDGLRHQGADIDALVAAALRAAGVVPAEPATHDTPYWEDPDYQDWLNELGEKHARAL